MSGNPLIPRPAATVLLVRDTPDGVEVFMERRHHQSGFVAGAYVFPGGRVDPEDAIDPARCVGLDDQGASRTLSVATGGLGFFVAAIRECFEEAGVLLAYDHRGALLDFGHQDVEDRYREYRQRLNARQVRFAELVDRERLRLATDRLAYWSHWITPNGESRRFDTRFFLAEAPAAQTAAHDDWELTDSAWVRPAEAIDRAIRQEWVVILPTIMNLRLLAPHRTARAAVQWAASQPLPLPAQLPKIHQGRVVLPGDPHYDDAEDNVSPADRAAFEARYL